MDALTVLLSFVAPLPLPTGLHKVQSQTGEGRGEAVQVLLPAKHCANGFVPSIPSISLTTIQGGRVLVASSVRVYRSRTRVCAHVHEDVSSCKGSDHLVGPAFQSSSSPCTREPVTPPPDTSTWRDTSVLLQSRVVAAITMIKVLADALLGAQSTQRRLLAADRMCTRWRRSGAICGQSCPPASRSETRPDFLH
ncbi:uncharacterized protein LOC121499277 isoform X2 [Vulpes lagopus]|uniref:uncharacterized protein LOC121499277 isoform X2 n=1 Tax=Vulpes lagopus TaxID=494514 RepID=UPI001BC9FD69|nr:uncharacterized protein LOC121499277 isoform X2 [Vulpes lagopus]